MGLTILHIEDEPDIRELVRLALEMSSEHSIAAFASGSEALDAAEGLCADLLLLDVMMPGMDGVELMARLRQHANLADVPVVFMTAKALDSEIKDLLRTGAAGVIPKPFDPFGLSDQLTGFARS